MASGARNCSAYEAAAFILASYSKSNDAFGDESSLNSSDSHDWKEEPCFTGMEVDKTQENEKLLFWHM